MGPIMSTMSTVLQGFPQSICPFFRYTCLDANVIQMSGVLKGATGVSGFLLYRNGMAVIVMVSVHMPSCRGHYFLCSSVEALLGSLVLLLRGLRS